MCRVRIGTGSAPERSSFDKKTAAHTHRMSGAPTDAAAEVEKLVVAVDDSEGSAHAFDWAVRYLHRPGVELHVVHIVPRLHFAAAYGVPPVDFVPVADRCACMVEKGGV